MELGRPLATVTPTLDGDVLFLLARTETALTVGQLRRVLPQRSAEGLRKVLRRLTDQGTVLTEQVGNVYSYRLNRDHLAAEPVLALAHIQQTFLERLSNRLASWPTPPVYAAVFGSAARGSMTPDSDIDLLLVLPEDGAPWEERVGALEDEVTRWTGNDARALTFTVADVVSRGADEPVLRDVLDHGLTVAGNSAWLVKHVQGRTG
ncbi:nucleotidyltransferase domain-containing protein [Actinokineospora fastidiosa]|uniref:Polymerase nucleotidyl transferase domain-containing protein n=1 Tax=Actinokineospora fastidiosa TaxID=1816 RepID=A0A918LGA3_9PSEU|nr:nucleotidyltransferase domain-containing protein [Actinokineospora fastidiosa]GGS43259.1 hypothetical protein GCM10010171_42950 [Actinokineospora fastidiosa]